MADRRGDIVEHERAGVIERILFARVELWAVLFLLLLGCLFVIGFGAAVLDAERGYERFGSVSRTALNVAEIPRTVKLWWHQDDDFRAYDTNQLRSTPTGWSFPSGRMTAPAGYLLLSRYDGTEKRHRIELVVLPQASTVFSWSIDAANLLKDVRHASRFAERNNWNNTRFLEVHPWLADNGDLIIKDFNSPLFRVDPCGKRVWTLEDDAYHHSTEADADGNLWIPAVAERSNIPGVDENFNEDLIAKVSPSGRVLYRKSVPGILIRHGLSNLLFSNGMYKNDPTHLNDIQPVLADSSHWKKGDLFLSLRNISTIMLYRPSTDEIIWIKRGPWTSQHDVDILDDHRIGVYDNAVEERAPLSPFFPGYSQVVTFDFSSGSIARPLQEVMERNQIRSWVEGLFTQFPDGSTMVEDTVGGRILFVRSDGELAAEYVNRAKDGGIYRLGWSRFIDKAKGDAVVRNLQQVRCHA